MANPFYIEPANPLQALMLGVQGYDRSQKLAKEQEQRAVLQDIGQQVQSGGIDNSALGRLFALGNPQLLTAAAALNKAKADGQGVYGTPIYGTDESGNTVLGAIGKQGEFRRIDTGGVTPTPGVKMLDTGTGFVPVQSRTGQPVSGGQYQPGQPSQQTPVGFIPKDNRGEAYQKKAGAEQAERDVALPEKKGKAEAALGDLKRQWQVVDGDITNAIKSIDSGWVPRAGIGSGLAAIPGTPQHDLMNLLNTIKSNIGFDKLQAMRQNSPTGGALGNVSDNENKLLQSVQGAIEQTQSPAQLKANLMRVQKLMKEVATERERAFNRDFGNVTVAPRQESGQNAGQTKTLGGKTYIQINGQWFEQ